MKLCSYREVYRQPNIIYRNDINKDLYLQVVADAPFVFLINGKLTQSAEVVKIPTDSTYSVLWTTEAGGHILSWKEGFNVTKQVSLCGMIFHVNKETGDIYTDAGIEIGACLDKWRALDGVTLRQKLISLAKD